MERIILGSEQMLAKPRKTMKQIEINVHTGDGVDSRLIKIAEDATIDDLIKVIQAAGAAVGELEEEIVLLVENDEKLLRREHKLCDHGIKHGNHVHFKKHGHDITVEVSAPRSPEAKIFTWPKTKLVGEAAAEAATAFGYVGGHPGLIKDKKVLDNNKTLAAAGVHNRDHLELTDTGGGV